MLKNLANGVNAIVLAGLGLTILSFSLIQVHGAPMWMICRNIILASLGEATPGLTIRGDINPVDVNCDNETGVCTVNRK